MAGFADFYRSVKSQESTGDYGAVNKRTGALGAFQIMPQNIVGWGSKAGQKGQGWDFEVLGRDISPAEFLANPQLQEQIASKKLEQAYNKHGPEGAARVWYGGKPTPSNRKAGNGNEPSPNEYAMAITRRMGKQGGSGGGGGAGSMDALDQLAREVAKPTQQAAKPARKNDVLDQLASELAARQPSRPERPNALESIGAGMNDIWQGVAQGANYLTDAALGGNRYERRTAEQNAAEQTYQDGRGADAGVDWGRMAGGVIATLPVAGLAKGFQGAKVLSTAGAKVLAQNAAVSGAVSGASFAPNASQRGANAVLGGALGAGGAIAGDKVVKGARAVAARRVVPIPAIDNHLTISLQQQGIDFAALDDSVKAQLRTEAAHALKVAGDLDPKAAANAATLANVGMRGTRGQILKETDPNQWRIERNAAQTTAGQPISAEFAAQHRILQAKMAELKAMTGGTTGQHYDTSVSLRNAAAAKLAEIETANDALWKSARESSGLEVMMNGQRFAKRANAALYDALAEKSAAPEIARRVAELVGGKKPMTIHDAQVLIQRINAKPPSDGSQAAAHAIIRKALERELDDALVNPQLVDSAGRPVNAALAADTITQFRTARAASRKYFNMLDENRMMQAATETTGKAGQPDEYYKKFIQQSTVAELKNMPNLLGPQGQQALNDARGEVVRQLEAKAFNQSGEFNYGGLRSAVAAIGEHRLAVLLQPKELELLDKIMKAGKVATVDPIEGKWNRSGSGGAVVEAARKLIGLIGTAGKATPLVRDVLDVLEQKAMGRQAAASAAGKGAMAGQAPRGSNPAADAHWQRAADIAAKAGATIAPNPRK